MSDEGVDSPDTAAAAGTGGKIAAQSLSRLWAKSIAGPTTATPISAGANMQAMVVQRPESVKA